MLALRGSPSSYADAYGVTATPPYDGAHLIIHMKTAGAFGDSYHPSTVTASWSVAEVSFDEADIFGTFHVGGHPGVIGLWLDAFTIGDTIDVYGLPDLLAAIDTSTYEVPDLQPAANGWMYVRGFTWAPPVGKRPYP